MFGKKKRDAEETVDVSDDAMEDASVIDDAATHAEYEDAEYEDDYEEEHRRRDPVVGWMTLMSVLLVLVVVVATGSIVYFLLAMRGAPRTAVERAITAAEAMAQEEPTVDNYVALGYSYLNAGRYREAHTAAVRSRNVKDTSMSDLLEADVARMQGNHEQAVKLYEKAAKRDDAETKKLVAAQQKKGIFVPPDRKNLINILIGKGESLSALKRTTEALKAFELAVVQDGTDAYALVRVGDLSAQLGKTKEAKAAYTESLRFIPDYEPALTGLSKLDDGVKE